MSERLTPKRRAMLERIARNSPLLELNISASRGGSSVLSALRSSGYVRRVEHPTVKRGGFPADALEITDTGRLALAQQEGK